MPLIDLSNLPSPPAGFGFAKDALGSVTGKLSPAISDTLKSASGAVTALNSKLLNSQISIPSFGGEANGPSLVDSMNAIKNGSINKDITASLGNIGDVASSLGEEAGAALTSAKNAIAGKMAAAQAQLPKLMAIAQANMDLTVKLSIANTGEPPTEDQLKAASGSLAVFQDGPAMLKAQAENISKSVAEAGAAFGAALPAGVDLAKAGLAKATSFAQSAGAAVSSFASSVPAQTIPDPSNPGETIPNPAYTAFAADPGNASKLSSLSGLTGALGTAAGGLTAAFGAIEAKANAAVAGGLTDLKAFAFASQLAAPSAGIMAQAKAASVDLSKVSPLQIAKANQMAAKVTVSTPPKNETVDGPDTKDPKLAEGTATAPTAKTKVVYDMPAGDKITQGFVEKYYKVFETSDKIQKSLTDSQLDDAEYFYPGSKKIRDDALAFEKIPEADRTAEQTRIIDKRSKIRAVIFEHAMFWQTYKTETAYRNALSTEYNILRSAYMANKTYGDLPLSVEGVPKSVNDRGEPKGFATFAEYKAANPGVDLSWDV
jgi:hypothetical protein